MDRSATYRATVSVRRIGPAAGLFLASLAVLLVRWLLPGPIGAADNGDGWRLLCHIDAGSGPRVSRDWIQLTYPPTGPCAIPDFSETAYVSTHTLLLRAAQWIGHRLGGDAALDLRVLGALMCVLVAAAVTLLALNLPVTRRGQVLGCALLLLVVADSAVFGWFVSVLSEGTAFLGILLATGGLLLLQRAGPPRYAGALLTVVGGVLAVNAKVQTLVLLLPLILALATARKIGRTVATRWGLPALVVAVTLSATVMLQRSGDAAGRAYAQANAYNTVFVSIVREEHAAEDLAEFGLPPSFARYQGVDWWQEQAAHSDPLWPQYQDRVTRRAVARYYLEHPVRTLEILHEGARDLLTARPENIGSYPEVSGQPAMAQEFRVPVLSGATRILAPLGLWALAPLWLLTVLGGTTTWRRARPLAVVVLFLVTAAMGQFAVAALGEGIEGVKHQLIALFCTLLGAVMAGVALLVRRAAGSAPADSPPDPPTARSDDSLTTAARHHSGVSPA